MATYTIDQIGITRTSANINDDDVFELQIKDGGSDDEKSAKITKAELQKVMNDGATPLRYKCSIVAPAPIASQTSGTSPVGLIWTIVAYESGDDFSNWELISGTANTTGAVYRATTTTPTTWDNDSELSYDGTPCISSTNADGDFAPFINTADPTAEWSVSGTPDYSLSLTGASVGKTFISGFSSWEFENTTYIPIIDLDNGVVGYYTLAPMSNSIYLYVVDDLLAPVYLGDLIGNNSLNIPTIEIYP